jgi:hypothetical protein
MAHKSTRNKEQYDLVAPKIYYLSKKINPATMAHRSNCPRLLAVRTYFSNGFKDHISELQGTKLSPD